MSKTKAVWFKKVRGSYLPISWQGWLCYVPFLAYMIGALIVIHHFTPSLVYTAFQVMVQWVVAAVVLTWIASRNS